MVRRQGQVGQVVLVSRGGTRYEGTTLRSEPDAAGIDDQGAIFGGVPLDVEHEHASPTCLDRQIDTGHRRDPGRPGTGGIDHRSAGALRAIIERHRGDATAGDVHPDDLGRQQLCTEIARPGSERLDESVAVEPALS